MAASRREKGRGMSNIPALKQIYAAFAAGDLPRTLSALVEDVDWQYGGDPAVPWLAPCRGRPAVVEALKKSAGLVEFRMRPKTFLESGLLVVVVLDADLLLKNGKVVHEEDAVHLWHFNQEGLVTRYRSRADTAAHERALENR